MADSVSTIITIIACGKRQKHWLILRVANHRRVDIAMLQHPPYRIRIDLPLVHEPSA